MAGGVERTPIIGYRRGGVDGLGGRTRAGALLMAADRRPVALARRDGSRCDSTRRIQRAPKCRAVLRRIRSGGPCHMVATWKMAELSGSMCPAFRSDPERLWTHEAEYPSR
jgi:hypothetical protein